MERSRAEAERTGTGTEPGGAPGRGRPEPPRGILETLAFRGWIETDAERGRAAVAFEAEPRLCHHGGVQGGFVAGWLDFAMAHAVMLREAGRAWPATLEVKVSYFEPVRPGTRVRAEGWIERSGRTVTFCEARLLDEVGTVLARASSTVRLVPFERGPARDGGERER